LQYVSKHALQKDLPQLLAAHSTTSLGARSFAKPPRLHLLPADLLLNMRKLEDQNTDEVFSCLTYLETEYSAAPVAMNWDSTLLYPVDAMIDDEEAYNAFRRAYEDVMFDNH
jgi:hypothetical protein